MAMGMGMKWVERTQAQAEAWMDGGMELFGWLPIHICPFASSSSPFNPLLPLFGKFSLKALLSSRASERERERPEYIRDDVLGGGPVTACGLPATFEHPFYLFRAHASLYSPPFQYS